MASNQRSDRCVHDKGNDKPDERLWIMSCKGGLPAHPYNPSTSAMTRMRIMAANTR